MKINAVPVEAYRQAGNQTTKNNNAGAPENFDLKHAGQSEKIILPGNDETDAGIIQAKTSPSLLSSILSSDEKDTLMNYFARFGDSTESTQIYSNKAHTKGSGFTGLKVDLTG